MDLVVPSEGHSSHYPGMPQSPFIMAVIRIGRIVYMSYFQPSEYITNTLQPLTKNCSPLLAKTCGRWSISWWRVLPLIGMCLQPHVIAQEKQEGGETRGCREPKRKVQNWSGCSNPFAKCYRLTVLITGPNDKSPGTQNNPIIEENPQFLTDYSSWAVSWFSLTSSFSFLSFFLF